MLSVAVEVHFGEYIMSICLMVSLRLVIQVKFDWCNVPLVSIKYVGKRSRGHFAIFGLPFPLHHS